MSGGDLLHVYTTTRPDGSESAHTAVFQEPDDTIKVYTSSGPVIVIRPDGPVVQILRDAGLAAEPVLNASARRAAERTQARRSTGLVAREALSARLVERGVDTFEASLDERGWVVVALSPAEAGRLGDLLGREDR
jgi:hypothetical protein